MPELPEVETVCRALSKVLTNSRIKKIEFYRKDLRWQVKDNLEVSLKNNIFIDPYRRGKYILIPTNTDKIFLIHLGMSGQIRIKKKDIVQKHDHMRMIVENNNKHFVVTYNDSRRFGYIDLFKKKELREHFLLSKIGVEPLGRELTTEYLKNNFKKRVINIKNALIDQKIIAGIGNIYASEILYKAKINPLRKVSSLSQNDLNSIITFTKIILKRSIDVGGTTIRDHMQPDGSLGYFKQKLQVYGKVNEKCKTCNSYIVKEVISNRSTFICKHCQI
ncbi:bifunctional DNA-formamidopyrimidine glycosylase/DNA-(apurinic or apyrimidinic site) lyase [Candidatus Levibacter sp. Uisw_134_01]|uniref:bifunctional DNA-formamidopyrimidine glycosylase/DNA-(apurinic or apyrimidinic site) lyase n=1 Tax=Candidatus Levibacter sp. Uisw_134_01 TaxID=3230999 RepID=UPI003D549236